ncbi:hypothetical protein HYX00_05570 [Candidatus Woesearchaeota archaeon]|nr:hypothetical protein [Candidatus Woesearchaeota archaeon]
MTYPTLEELAESNQSIDVSEFGLKTEGLVELIRDKPLFDFRYEIPPGFVIGKSVELDIEKLRRSYFGLIPNPNDFCVIMPRSSDEDEEPGKLPTEFVLYDSANPERSFSEFVEAVQRVKENPSKAVVVNLMIGEVVYLKREPLVLLNFPLFDESLDYKVLAQQIKDKIPKGWNDEIKIGFYIGNELISTTFFTKPSKHYQRWSGLEAELSTGVPTTPVA